MEVFKKKAALITGSARRIAADIALGLAAEGYDIAIHYNSSEDEAIETQKKVKSSGRECAIFKGDLRDIHFVNELFMVAFSTYPNLNVLVNSASVF